jgi:Domain of unknown function (DUF3846)
MATLIPAVGAPRFVEPANGGAFTLAELQAFVGGYIELLRVPLALLDPPTGPLVLFCNEDGKRLRLPINRFATSLMRPVLQPDDVLVGDVILCTPGEAGEGEEADDPDRP